MVYSKALLLPLLSALLAQAVPNRLANDVGALAVRGGGGHGGDGRDGHGDGRGDGRGDGHRDGDRDDDRDDDRDGHGGGRGGDRDRDDGRGPRRCESHKDWRPVGGGCWQDHNRDRALDHYLGSIEGLTVEKCLDMCEEQGFFLAGVEFGKECSCGNTILDRNGPTSDDKCNMPCVGNPKELCGGQDAMNLYVRDNFKFTTGPAQPLGQYKNFARNQCQVDSTSNRTLKSRPKNEYQVPTDMMTVGKCVDACAASGFNNAGLVFGRECYCDNAPLSLPGPARPIDECNMPCLGDGSAYCGGPDRVLIYSKNGFRN